MSGMDTAPQPTNPEAAAPKMRDFATTKNFKGEATRGDEKHDTPTMKIPKADKATSVLRVNRGKENTMLRRMRDMAMAPLRIGGGNKA